MKRSLFLLLAFLLVFSACTPASHTPAVRLVTPKPPIPATSKTQLAAGHTQTSGSVDPFNLISADSLLSFTQDLSTIQAYSGWRNSGSAGESEAQDYVQKTLEGYAYLKDLGLEFERQSFHVFLSTEFWQEDLSLTIDGQKVDVPAEAIRGSRDIITNALHLDSDGKLNDSDRNPVQASGSVLLVADQKALDALQPQDVAGKVLLVPHPLIDEIYQKRDTANQNAIKLFELNPTGIVIVAKNSNKPGVDHSTFLGDNSAPARVDNSKPRVPVLFFRIEDLRSAGIHDYPDLAKIQSADLVWDVDVFSPGTSSNLVAHIPGRDSSKAIILGGHIDSPNSPGALDDGSGSVTLMEVARVLNESQTQPPYDLYLTWFGSEELGLYGSSYFSATHQDLLDRTIGMLQIDDLTQPVEGIDAYLGMNAWPYREVGAQDDSLPWAEHLAEQATSHGVTAEAEKNYTKYSDNNTFDGFDVPNTQLGYFNESQMARLGGPWPAGHIHDPYDNLDAVKPVVSVLEDMVKIALTAALEPPADVNAMHIPPVPIHRALIVASHTEANHMNPTEANEFGMTLALAGFDVDLIPYDQPVTEQDLQNTDLVIVEPVYDFPSKEGDVNQYDTAWTQPELDVLQSYVENGGLLVITNSYHRIKHGLQLWEENEDRLDQNALSERFGVTFSDAAIPGALVVKGEDHPITTNFYTSRLQIATDNGVEFKFQQGSMLAKTITDHPVIALVPFGQKGGEVLVVGDSAIFANIGSLEDNLKFWQGLAEYAAGR